MNLVWSGNGKEAEEAGTQEIDNEVEDVSGGQWGVSQSVGLGKSVSEAGFYLKCNGAF